jgi:hypothetical protein
MHISEDLILNDPRFLRLPEYIQLIYIKTCALAAKNSGVISYTDEEASLGLRIETDQWDSAKGALLKVGLFTERKDGLAITGYENRSPTPTEFVPGTTVAKILAQEARLKSRGNSLNERYPWIRKWSGRFAQEYDHRMIQKVIEYLKTTPGYAPREGTVPTANSAKAWISKGVAVYIDDCPHDVGVRYQQCLLLWEDVRAAAERPTNMAPAIPNDTIQVGKQYVAMTNATPEEREAMMQERREMAQQFRRKVKGE